MTKSKTSKNQLKNDRSSRTLLMGVGLAVFALVVSLLYAYYGWSLSLERVKEVGERVVIPQPAKTRETRAPAVLALSPRERIAEPGEEFAVQVELDTGNRKVSSVDAVLTFNNEILEVSEVQDGDGFSRYLNEQANSEGRVFVTAVMDPGRSFQGQGNLGTIVFRAKETGDSVVGFVFEPEAEGSKGSGVFEAGTGAEILGETRDALYSVTK